MNDALMTGVLSLLCLGCGPFHVEAQPPLADLPMPQAVEVAPVASITSTSVTPTARQATTPSNTAATQAPLYADGENDEAGQYSGELGTVEGDRTFSEFLLANDDNWVNLDVYISENSEHYGEDWIALCADTTLEDNCTAVSINYDPSDVEALFLGEADGVRTLQGYWQVRVNPGMYQGFLSVSLLAIP